MAWLGARGPSTALDQPEASCSSRCVSRWPPRWQPHSRCLLIPRAALNSIRGPPQRPAPPSRHQNAAENPRPRAPPSSSPSRLLTRPDHSSAPQLQQRGQVGPQLDDQDSRMAAYEALIVNTTTTSSSSSRGLPLPDPLPSFNSLFRRRPALQLQKRMRRLGFMRPTPLQRHLIAAIRTRRDVLGVGPPGSGLTLGTLIAALKHLISKPRSAPPNRSAYPLVVVLVPSRELVGQLVGEAGALLEGGHVRVRGVSGGGALVSQVMELKGGADLLVATPGRLAHLVDSKVVNLARVMTLVCEEVDLMVSPGLEATLRRLLTHPSLPPPSSRQTIVLASSTAPPRMLQLAADSWLQPNYIQVAASWPTAVASSEATAAPQQPAPPTSTAGSTAAVAGEENKLPAAAGSGSSSAPPSTAVAAARAAAAPALGSVFPGIRQRVLGLAPRHKPRVLQQLLAGPAAAGGAQGLGVGGLSLVFVEDQETANQVHSMLEAAGLGAGLLHMGRSQIQRDEAVQCFKFGVTPVLVATSLAARGLDFPDVSSLVNYDMPREMGEYARRLGRLGRVGQPGVATTLFTQADVAMAGPLAVALRAARQQVPEWLDEMAAAGPSAGGSSSSSSSNGKEAAGGDGGGVGQGRGGMAAAAGTEGVQGGGGRPPLLWRGQGRQPPQYGAYLHPAAH